MKHTTKAHESITVSSTSERYSSSVNICESSACFHSTLSRKYINHIQKMRDLQHTLVQKTSHLLELIIQKAC